MRDVVVAMFRRPVGIQQSSVVARCGTFRGLVVALVTVGVAACGSSTDSDTAVKTMPPDSLSFGTDTIVLAPGLSSSLNLRVGNLAVSAANYSWTSSKIIVAQIAVSGRVLALAPGTTVITGSGGGSSGSVVVKVAENLHLADFKPPLSQSVSNSTVFDHDLPIGFSDANGYSLSYWGERLLTPDLGHNGYDWPVPQGTPVLASAPGAVIYAATDSPAPCALLNGAVVASNTVVIVHGLSDGSAVETEYLHFSRIDVVYGQRVETGQQLGLSGSTGCSTGPHLHFTVARGGPADANAPIAFDPYGWVAAGPDPWAVDPRGTTSETLWPSATFPIYRERKLVGVFAVPSPVVMTLVRYMGVDDAHNPNNEYIDIAANPSFGDADLTGLSIRNAAGTGYDFPAGTHLQVGNSLRVFTGPGTNTPAELHMGKTEPLLNNDLDCVELVRRDSILFNVQWGGGNSLCLGQAQASVSVTALPRDAATPATLQALRGQTRIIRTP